MKNGKLIYIIAAVCTCMMAFGTMGLVNAYGVFYKPMADSLGSGQGAVTLHMSVSNLVVGLCTPLVAGMISRNFRIKNILTAGAVLILISGFVIAMTDSLLVMNIAAAVRGIGFASVSMMIITLIIGNWFVKYRGTLTGIALSFSGIGSALASPILSSLISSYGWQKTYIGYVVFIVLCIIPSLLFVPLKPQDIGLRPFGENEADSPETKNTAETKALPFERRSALFTVLIVLVLSIVLLTSLSPHLSSLAQAHGYDASVGAALLSFSMIGNVVSKFALGAMVDRIGAFKGVVCMLVTSFAGLVLILLNPGGTAMLLAAGFLYGTCYSIGSLGISMITRTLYGDKQYSSAYSVITLFTSVASAVGLTLIGFLYDLTGTYAVSVISGMVLVVTAFFALMFIQKKAKD
ncbi:MAG: MFS transporter [Solobacterium sp.]|nr:MFS transporter [Solobacterium sp.]